MKNTTLGILACAAIGALTIPTAMARTASPARAQTQIATAPPRSAANTRIQSTTQAGGRAGSHSNHYRNRHYGPRYGSYYGGFGYPYNGSGFGYGSSFGPFGFGSGYGYPGYGYPYYGASAALYYNGTQMGERYGYRNGGDGGSIVARVQQRLARAGYYRGSIDGVAGDGTRRAIRAFERANGLRVDGQISNELLSRLRG